MELLQLERERLATERKRLHIEEARLEVEKERLEEIKKIRKGIHTSQSDLYSCNSVSQAGDYSYVYAAL